LEAEDRFAGNARTVVEALRQLLIRRLQFVDLPLQFGHGRIPLLTALRLDHATRQQKNRHQQKEKHRPKRTPLHLHYSLFPKLMREKHGDHNTAAAGPQRLTPQTLAGKKKLPHAGIKKPRGKIPRGF